MSETSGTSPISIERIGAAIVARINLKLLDDKSLKSLITLVDNASGDTTASIVVMDLSRVQMLPSLALGALAQLASRCRARKQRIALAAAQPQIQQVLKISKLDQILVLADSVEAAVQA